VNEFMPAAAWKDTHNYDPAGDHRRIPGAVGLGVGLRYQGELTCPENRFSRFRSRPAGSSLPRTVARFATVATQDRGRKVSMSQVENILGHRHSCHIAEGYRLPPPSNESEVMTNYDYRL